MRRFILLLALATVAWAQPGQKMWKLELQLVKVPAAQGDLARCQILDDDTWAGHLRAGRAKVLSSGSVIGRLGTESLTFVGGKIPIGYKDPRTGSYQVQYIDSGWKIDAKVAEERPGLWDVECQAEQTLLTGDSPAGLPEQDALKFNTSCLLKPGQTALVGAGRGRISSQFTKQVLAKETISESDTVLFALTVRQP